MSWLFVERAESLDGLRGRFPIALSELRSRLRAADPADAAALARLRWEVSHLTELWRFADAQLGLASRAIPNPPSETPP